MKNVILPLTGIHRLSFFLAMEEYLAGSRGDDLFFVWQSDPTVIIGRNQDLEAEVNLDYCREHGIVIVRRRSGGGCVYSDRGNVMLSFISRRGNVSDVFDSFLLKFASCLESMGVPAEKSGRNDILVEGRKVSGNAFQQLPDRSIVHGTLMYSVDYDVLETSIRPPVEKLERHGVPSVRQRVRNLKEYVDSQGLAHESLQSVESLMDYITGYFCDGCITLSEDDVRKIEIIEKEYINTF